MYRPKLRISNKVLKNIGQIEAAKEIIENAALVPSFEKKFQTDATLRTVYHGTQIEGNDLTLDQTKRVLEGKEVYARARDIQEVINYRKVVELLEELASKRGDYDTEMLKDIHRHTVFKVVSEDRIGVFRTTQVVVKDEGTGEVIFKPPAFIEVPYLLADFFEWLNSEEGKDTHPIIRAAIAHYVLVAVHPFVEGNGRSARAFASLILLKEGYDIKKFFSLEEHFDADPASYYEAIAVVDKESPHIGARDLTAWLEYFTETLAVELTKIKERVRKLSVDTRLKLRFGEQVALSERQMRVVEHLTDQGPAGMKQLKKVLPMVSDDTVLRDLQDMISKKIVKKEGSTKAAVYTMATKP